MKRLFITAIAAPLLLVAAPAGAAVQFSFVGGAASPDPGYEVINTFDDATGIVGVNFQIKTPPADGDGAPPANSSPSGTSYLSVLGGGSASLSFSAVPGFQFDWGSIDTYNTLTIFSSGGNPIVVPGGNFINPANGNQVSPGTNGLFTVWGDAGETFTGFTLTSSQNSFEIDNLAVAVPEPAAWAMMILGFGGVGAMMRSRRRNSIGFAT